MNEVITIHLLYFVNQGTIANSLTCLQLHKRAEKIAVMLMERGHLQDGDHVALVYPPGRERLYFLPLMHPSALQPAL